MEEIKRLTNERRDLNDFYALYLYCFKGLDSLDRQNYFNYRYDHSLKYAIKEGQHIKSGLLSIPLEVNFYGIPYKMNGICDVATYPEFGGQGKTTAIMKTALREMYNNQTALSYLAPFSYDFYRKFGYETVFEHCRYQIKSHDFPKIAVEKRTGHVERCDFKAALPLIKSLYDEDSQNHRGGLIRSNWWWKYLTLKRLNWEVAVYFDNVSRAKGYLIYSDNETIFKIHDFCFNDALGYRHLLKFVSQHQSMYQVVEYESSCPIATLDIFAEPRLVHTNVIPYMMARIVNLETFITHYPFLKDFDTIQVSIDDQVLPENKGIWKLSVKNGEVHFEKITENEQETAELYFSIQTLTQAFLGSYSLEQLMKTGQLRGNLDVMTVLSKGLINKKPQIQDYF